MPFKTFNNFKIDSWYKVFIYLGGIIFIGSLFIRTTVFDNKDVILFGLGLLLIGLSIWSSLRGAIFFPTGEEIKTKEPFTIQIKFLAKKLLFIIGLFLVVYSVYEIIIKHYIT